MQFGYDARPSFWQEVKSNSHLVIAAVGTAALLGVAGTALWLAMPAGERQAFAQIAQAEPAEPALKAQPAEIKATSQPTLASVETVVQPKTTPKADAVTLQTAEAEADLETLPAGDPRWSGSTHKQARAPAEGAVEAQKEATPVPAAAATATTAPPAAAEAPAQATPTPEQAASVAAYQPVQAEAAPQAAPQEQATARPKPDKAATAAIPIVNPVQPATDETADDGATRPGRIARDVTLRSGPKKGAAAIGTIPAKTAVQVVSCKSWCQIVYKGKRGWIYKSFLDGQSGSGGKGNSGGDDSVQTQSIAKPPPAPAKATEPVVPDPQDARRSSSAGHT
jgi:hypothetical protein